MTSPNRAWGGVLALVMAGAPGLAAGAPPAPLLRLDAIYVGPAYAPVLGTGVVGGVQWRAQPWLAAGVELGIHDQSPLRTNLAARLQVVFDYTCAFGGYAGVRLGAGYRRVFVRGETYSVRDERVGRSEGADFDLWSTTAELALGVDARRFWALPLRLTVAPGVHAAYPQLDGFGVDLWLTTRLAWVF